MRIAIVNDLPLAVESIKACLRRHPGYEVAWVAYDGEEAVRKCLQDRPDVVLMDLIMPVLDGVEATRRIMAQCPCPILVVTSSVTDRMPKVYEAMSNGALDAVNTPESGSKGGEALLAKIAVVGRLIGSSAEPASAAPAEPPAGPRSGNPYLIAIGASTGGPQALVELLGALPAACPAALVIIQHVDVMFVKGLAAWLGEKTALGVGLAEEGGVPRAGQVSIAATNNHLVIGRDLAFHYTADPVSCPYRPSVDAFFLSLERHWPDPGAAVLLTGMGRDGAAGLLALRRKGWHTLAQDEKTSLIYSMPKAAAELKAAQDILPPVQIASVVSALSQMRSKGA